VSLAIVKKPLSGTVHKKRCDGVHGNLNKSHTSHPNLHVSTIQHKPNCPCGGGCPCCKNDLIIQPKLRSNKPGDTYGQKVDRVAEAMVKSKNSPILQQAVTGAGTKTGTGTKESEDPCAGWFSDHESTSKRAAEHYVRTELTGDRGVVEKIECDLFNPDTGAFACTVYFTDGTPIRVIVRKDAIIVGVHPLRTMHPPPDRPLCWYDYQCSGLNRNLVLTKRKCQTSKPDQGTSLPKTHGPEP
jgi:hypothetical protein